MRTSYTVGFIINLIKYKQEHDNWSTEGCFSSPPTAKYVNGEGKRKNYIS